jgi:hypothetical protein
VFIAGAAWSITENVVEVYQGNKSVGKAFVAVAMDVSGASLVVDGYKYCKEKIQGTKASKGEQIQEASKGENSKEVSCK